MHKPNMILFDYGHTLIYEASLDAVRGVRELLKHAVQNKRKLSAEAVGQFSSRISAEMGKVRDAGFEIHNHMFQRFVYEYLEITFDLTNDEMEDIFWDHFAPGQAMPHIEALLKYLHEKGILTGVISNISFSGGALERRINRLIPGHHFAFIIASSEYAIRKPDPRIFTLALRKAGLNPQEAWYCGDNPYFDIMGAASVGIYPVLYESSFVRPYGLTPPHHPEQSDDATSLSENANDTLSAIPHIVIKNWLELIQILEML